MPQETTAVNEHELAPLVVSPPLPANRLDVLVHLLAIEQTAGRSSVDIDLSTEMSPTGDGFGDEPQRSPSASVHFSQVHRTDWVERSEAFSRIDGARRAVDRMLEASTSDVELVAKFAFGGHVVGSAVDIAVAMYLDRNLVRVEARDARVDRSVGELRANGWSHGDLRGVLHRWAQLDPQSAVVILDAAHIDFEMALHELTCRFEVMHSEVDFISRQDQKDLKVSRSGTAQTLLLRAERPLLGDVLRSHDGVCLGSFASDFSLVPLSVLWSPTRTIISDTVHDRRLRNLRLRSVKEQLVDRLPFD